MRQPTRTKPFLIPLMLALMLALSSGTAARATVSQPLEIINRPRTLPGGQLELQGGIDLTRSSYTDMTGTHSDTRLAAPLGLGAGVSDDLDLYVFYSLGLHPTFTGKTPLEVRLAYTFLRDGPLTAAAQVRSGIDLGSNDVTPLRLGVNAFYKVSATLAFFTPGEQLAVGLAGDNHFITLDLPLGLGLQLAPQVFGSLTTSLAHIAIANAGTSAFILADMIPLSLAAFYSFSPRADVGAHVDIDLKNTDVVVFGVLARLFL